MQFGQRESMVTLHPTSSCPKSHPEWYRRSSALNCTDSSGYMCLPNRKLTELIEFCFSLSLMGVQKGNKNTEQTHVFGILHFDCYSSFFSKSNGFLKPAMHVVSSIFNYCNFIVYANLESFNLCCSFKTSSDFFLS